MKQQQSSPDILRHRVTMIHPGAYEKMHKKTVNGNISFSNLVFIEGQGEWLLYKMDEVSKIVEEWEVDHGLYLCT